MLLFLVLLSSTWAVDTDKPLPSISINSETAEQLSLLKEFKAIEKSVGGRKFKENHLEEYDNIPDLREDEVGSVGDIGEIQNEENVNREPTPHTTIEEDEGEYVVADEQDEPINSTKEPNVNATQTTVGPVERDEEYENIMLDRNNCNAEFNIVELEERKLNLQFSDNIKDGKTTCKITLRARETKKLALYLSHLRLGDRQNSKRFRQPKQKIVNNPCPENLRVLLKGDGHDFEMKRYCGDPRESPAVLLTETDTVYLILENEEKPETKQNSGFKLEVFTYNSHAKNIMSDEGIYPGTSGTYNGVNVNQIYFTTQAP